jgi:hypothetical protein
MILKPARCVAPLRTHPLAVQHDDVVQAWQDRAGPSREAGTSSSSSKSFEAQAANSHPSSFLLSQARSTLIQNKAPIAPRLDACSPSSQRHSRGATQHGTCSLPSHPTSPSSHPDGLVEQIYILRGGRPVSGKPDVNAYSMYM